MPLYEYRCQQCGTVFEKLQKFTDPPLTVHPGCGGAVERLLSPPALQFKGTGWYITDYARKNGGSSPAGKNGGHKAESTSKPAESSKPAEARPSKSSDTAAQKS